MVDFLHLNRDVAIDESGFNSLTKNNILDRMDHLPLLILGDAVASRQGR